MKKLFGLLLVIVCTAAHSQLTMSVSHTPLTNGDTSYLTLKATDYFSQINIQAVVTKTSGTVGGNAILQGSIDGSNFETISNDTLTLANQAINSKIWKITPSSHVYYRVRVISSGTQVSVPTGYFVARNEFLK